MTRPVADSTPAPGPSGQPGRLYVGTSGFSYPAWAPLFYRSGLRSSELLSAYATRLTCVELNNTFYRHPTETSIAAWCAATPASFRFAVKAQKGGSIRALTTDPVGTVTWLTRPYRAFGDRLGCVLFRIPENIRRDDERLAALLAAWPGDLPLVVECRDPSWAVDEVFDLLRTAGAAWCATELDDDPGPPTLRLTAPWLYVRLRRASYTEAELAAWADRVAPFLDAGHDCYAVFRHDADGASALRGLTLAELVAARRTAAAPARPAG